MNLDEQFATYLERVSETKKQNSTWRMGQTYFNVLCETRSDIAEKLRGTLADPFYSDERIGAFLSVVYAEWVMAPQQ